MLSVWITIKPFTVQGNRLACLLYTSESAGQKTTTSLPSILSRETVKGGIPNPTAQDDADKDDTQTENGGRRNMGSQMEGLHWAKRHIITSRSPDQGVTHTRDGSRRLLGGPSRDTNASRAHG